MLKKNNDASYHREACCRTQLDKESWKKQSYKGQSLVVLDVLSMFICLAELLVIPWLTSWLMKTCALAAGSHWWWFLFEICEWGSNFHEQSENAQWWIVVQAVFLVWHCRTGCSQPADLGRYALALLILEAALTTAGRGTRAAASDCGSLVSLDFSCARGTLASPLPWPVLSMRWKRPISHLVHKVLNNYLWTSFPFAPYFSAKSEQH